jgi:NAD(P)-dependent dehydrogenase (short-subunit alcohol dehydrogenase family)
VTASPALVRPVDPGGLFDLAGRTAVVTGASSGLGARFAAVLAAAGATVFAAARRADRLAELAAGQPLIRPFSCDIGVEEDRAALIAAACARTGRVDILVNNAGISGPTRAVDEDDVEFRSVLDVNVVAAFRLAVLTAQAAAGGGQPVSVVNVASILGIVSGAPLGGASYSASKAALIGLTRELAGQWGRHGVRVNALAPGWFRTEMTEDLFADEKSSAWVDRNTLLHRAGEPGELDGALLFLASEASSYCTGQVLVIDGGWTAR